VGLSTYHKFIIIMTQTLAIIYTMMFILELNFPLVLIFSPGSEQVSSYGLLSEYIGFIGISIIEFIIALGLLYLIFKMGQHKLNLDG